MLNIRFVTLAKSNVPCLWRKRCCTCTSTVAYFLHYTTAWWIWDSSKFYPIKPKLDIGLFVEFCVFTCFYQFLHDKIVLQIKTKQWSHHAKTGKNTEINKQSDVKFWLNWRKYGTVSYSFSCIKTNFLLSKKTLTNQTFFLSLKKIQTTFKLCHWLMTCHGHKRIEKIPQWIK